MHNVGHEIYDIGLKIQYLRMFLNLYLAICSCDVIEKWKGSDLLLIEDQFLAFISF